MKRYLQLAFTAALVLTMSACGSGKTESTAEGNDFLVTIKTSQGDMKAILYEDTPLHRENFVKLIKDGFYDSLLFHRVIQGFMIQGGDPNSRNAGPNDRLGNGGPGYTIPSEIKPNHFHKKGALSAARQGDAVNPQRESSGSQFYIVQGQIIPAENSRIDMQALGIAVRQIGMEQSDSELNKQLEAAYNEGGSQGFQDKAVELIKEIEEATGTTLTKEVSSEKMDAYAELGGTPFLDDQYTVFGEVIDGLDVIDKIAATRTLPGDRPQEDIKMFITVEEVPKAEIEDKYGYTYK